MSPEVLFSKVIDVLVANESPVLSIASPAYMTGEGHKAYGVSIVLLRKLLKPYFADYAALTFPERLNFATRLYDTKMAEAMISANAFLGRHFVQFCVDERNGNKYKNDYQSFFHLSFFWHEAQRLVYG